MPTTPPPLRVALAAAPELLADTLRTLLVDDRTEVSVVVSGANGDHFDLAVLSPDSDVEVDADVRIVLDDGPGTSGGGTVNLPGGFTSCLADLREVIAFVRELATGGAVLTGPEG